jgi:hypothetical protein
MNCDQPTEILIDYLQDLICELKDPEQVGVLVDVMLRLRSERASCFQVKA